jgi:hypothetical protein
MSDDIDLEALSTNTHGYTVDDEDDDDPVLLDRDGRPVDTWRERIPVRRADVARRVRGGPSGGCRSSY